MSETKSLAAPKASFDRRAVVKGAAWSVPVIAAAIAAPAAAASHHTATPTKLSASIVMSSTAPTFPGNPKVEGTGSWPTGFTISTSGAADVVGTVSVTVTITRREAGNVNLLLGKIDGKDVSSTGTWTGDLLVPGNGVSPTFTFAFSRTGGAAPSAGVLTYDIAIDITAYDYATDEPTVMDRLTRVVTIQRGT